MDNSSPTNSSRWRFTFRGLLLAFLFLALVLAYASSERRAYLKLKRYGIRLQYAEQELDRAQLEIRNLQKGKISDRNRSFWEADLEGTDLAGMKILSDENAFQKASFRKCNLKKSSLQGGAASFQMARFENAILVQANLAGGDASFQAATFNDADLSDAVLIGGFASFQSSSFENAKLVGAKLQGDFTQTNISGAKLEGADLSGIPSANLASFYFKEPPTYNSKTTFPVGFDPVTQSWRRSND